MTNVESNKLKAKLSECSHKVEVNNSVATKKQAIKNMQNFNKVIVGQSIAQMRKTGRH